MGVMDTRTLAIKAHAAEMSAVNRWARETQRRLEPHPVALLILLSLIDSCNLLPAGGSATFRALIACVT